MELGIFKQFWDIYIFFKLYCIDYAITVIPVFPHLLSFPQRPHPLKQIPIPLFIFLGHVYKFFGYSISYTVLYIPMAIL